MKFAEIPTTHVPPGLLEVGRFGDYLGEWLEALGGAITDLGFDPRSDRAEIVVQTLNGTRLEITIRNLTESPLSAERYGQ